VCNHSPPLQSQLGYNSRFRLLLLLSRHNRIKLVPPKPEPENQALETLEESSLLEQKEESVIKELDMEMECPRCNDVMELSSSFDVLAYCCVNCSFILKCVSS
jgi:hypothetical protein